VEPPAAEEPKPPVQVEPIKPPEVEPVVEKPPAPVIKPIRPVMEEPKPQPQPRPVQQWLRPNAVQLHDGRIEISLPYTLGVTVLLVAILLVVGAFRLGQMQHRVQPPAVRNIAAGPAKQVTPKPEPAPAPAKPEVKQDVKLETPAPVKEPTNADTAGTTTAPAAKPGDHVIVLAQNAKSDPLKPAQTFFKEHGVPTEIIDVKKLAEYLTGAGLNTNVLGTRSGFMLVTSDYYDNPANPGTNGFEKRQEIIKLGQAYKSVSGSQAFSPKYFSDAYGMKVR
jgi:hypothetical protein